MGKHTQMIVSSEEGGAGLPLGSQNSGKEVLSGVILKLSVRPLTKDFWFQKNGSNHS